MPIQGMGMFTLDTRQGYMNICWIVVQILCRTMSVLWVRGRVDAYEKVAEFTPNLSLM